MRTGVQASDITPRYSGSSNARPAPFATHIRAFSATVTGKPVEQRLAGSLAGALAAVAHGAAIVRVHDVAATRQGLAIWSAMHSQDTQTAT